LILEIFRLLESLIVIGACHRCIRGAKIDATDLRTEQPRTGVSHHGEGAQSMKIIDRHSHQSAVNFRLAELDREIKRCIQDGIEVVRTVREFPEILSLNGEPVSEVLLESYVELVPSRGSEGMDLIRTAG
jgi:hypothetical protein